MTRQAIERAEAGRTIRRKLCGVGLTVLALAACDDLLTVSSPGSLEESQLANPALEKFLVNGAIGEFQTAYVSYALYSGVLADEVFTDHSSSADLRALSLHQFDDLNLTNEEVYANLQRARQSADDATDRLKTMLGPNAASSLNVARALIYGGYSYVLLAEGFCEAPVNLSVALSSTELFTRGIARFDEGLRVASAARTGADATDAENLIGMAQVGAARASLKMGNRTKARAYAAEVPDAFERIAYYSSNSPREYNQLQIFTRTTSPYLGMQPAFQDLNDPRIPRPATPRTSLAGRQIIPPLKPSMYSGWSPITPAPIEVATHIRFASGLEARYIAVEADGPTAAMLAFVNTRRGVARKAPVSLSGSELVAEFRMQRALEFYLTGQRLGDLRRYAAAGTDLFPTGKFPTLPDPYGTMHCFIVPRSEKAGNPNY